MRNLVGLWLTFVILGVMLTFLGSDSEILTEPCGTADVISCRIYSRFSGGFLSSPSRECVEYIFYYDGEMKIESSFVSSISIGDMNVVNISSSRFCSFYTLTLTLEDYQKLVQDGYWES